MVLHSELNKESCLESPAWLRFFAWQLLVLSTGVCFVFQPTTLVGATPDMLIFLEPYSSG
jgi:hypothetical protein